MTNSEFKFHSIPEILKALKEGEFVVLLDDADRENEGDLVLAADFVTAEKVNFMVKEARGLVCLAITEAQRRNLDLNLMVPVDGNGTANKTAFTVSIEASEGVTTGISAADRAHTLFVASRPQAKPSDVSRPGHIFPLVARPLGVLERRGHTEASVDLMKLAELSPAAVICEVMREDGAMARLPDLFAFAKKFNLKIGTIEDLVHYLGSKRSSLYEPKKNP